MGTGLSGSVDIGDCDLHLSEISSTILVEDVGRKDSGCIVLCSGGGAGRGKRPLCPPTGILNVR